MGISTNHKKTLHFDGVFGNPELACALRRGEGLRERFDGRTQSPDSPSLGFFCPSLCKWAKTNAGLDWVCVRALRVCCCLFAPPCTVLQHTHTHNRQRRCRQRILNSQQTIRHTRLTTARISGWNGQTTTQYKSVKQLKNQKERKNVGQI